MDDSVLYLLMDDSREILREQDFSGFGDTPGIPVEHIVIRDAPLEDRESDQQRYTDESYPGIIISPGNISRPSSAGTNEMDDADYTVVFQIIDRSDSRYYEDQTRSHLLWCQVLSRALHGRRWDSEQIGDSWANLSWTEETRILDPNFYWRHERLVRAVLARFWVREARTSNS